MAGEAGESVAEITKELGICGSSLRRWLKEKVRFRNMGTHFSILHTKLRNYTNKSMN